MDSDGRDDAEAATPWERVLADLERIAEDLADEDWLVFAAAAETSRIDPEDDAFVYRVAEDDAADLDAAFAANRFDHYDAFTRRTDGRLFVVLRLFDADERVAVLLAGRFDAASLEDLPDGVAFTRVESPDGTEVGSFRHDAPENLYGG